MKVLIAAALLSALAPSSAAAECLPVADDPGLSINPEALAKLRSIKMDRKAIFAALREVSQTETSGCWAAPDGNFDGQVLSVGTAQWNYGKESLQPLLKRFHNRYLTPDAFRLALRDLMPTYGETIFSDGCLAMSRKPKGMPRVGGMSEQCKQFFKSKTSGHGGLDPELASEFERLFNSTVMRQIQIDEFVALLGSVRSDLLRVFPGRAPTPVQIQWAIDLKVQQGSLPTDAAIKRVRAEVAKASAPVARQKELDAVHWYEFEARGWDQDGVRLDIDYNVRAWSKFIADPGLTPEQLDLFTLTLLRSRTSQGEDGRWQALTFERRMKIILGVGSVGGNTDTRARTT